MNILEQYDAALDRRAQEERCRAEACLSDEREHSIHLMQASMLGDMLKSLGRAQHEGARPGILRAQIASLTAQAERERAREDFDAADRALVKARTIEWALQTLTELENRHE